MAGFNEILVGSYNRFLQKLLGMKGVPVMPSLASELYPTLQFFSGAENRVIQAWRLFANRWSVAASAANNSAIQFRNPTGSNLVVVITKILVFETATDVILFGTQHTNLGDLGANLGTEIAFDGRDTTLSGMVLSQGNGIGTSFLWGAGQFVTGGQLDMISEDIQEIPVLPGDTLRVYSTALNVGMTVTIFWRQRHMEESERAE